MTSEDDRGLCVELLLELSSVRLRIQGSLNYPARLLNSFKGGVLSTREWRGKMGLL